MYSLESVYCLKVLTSPQDYIYSTGGILRGELVWLTNTGLVFTSPGAVLLAESQRGILTCSLEDVSLWTLEGAVCVEPQLLGNALWRSDLTERDGV